uniref:DUF148 domain-containing protein n=1 Tax=Meloidogyne hapla TaxID=6305 RepID=A0A1I8BFV9_MELHA
MSKIFFSLILFVTFFAITISFGFGGPRGIKNHLLPPFINNITREQISQYIDIVSNPNATKAQIKTNLQSWAQNAGILTIRQDDSITRLAECQQIKEALRQATPEVRQQVPLVLPSILGPPPRGCCPRPFSRSSSSEQQPADNTVSDHQQDSDDNESN